MTRFCFIAAGSIDWASSRMRCYWPAAYMDATVIDYSKTQEIPAAEVYIWQKVFNADIMRQQRKQGAQVWWDVCDPLWWFVPDAVRPLPGIVTGIVASSSELAGDCGQWSRRNVWYVPDRVELSHFTGRRPAHDDHRPVRLIWFGLAANRIALFNAVDNLQRLRANGYDFELTLYDDKPEQGNDGGSSFPVYRIGWRLDQEVAVIAAHDIALLPSYPGPWGRVKSNNKHVTAWACGLPTADGDSYMRLVQLVDGAGERQRQADACWNEVCRAYDVRLTAAKWDEMTNVSRGR